jgi:hypothetical protein
MTWLALGAGGVLPLALVAGILGEEALWAQALELGLGFGLAVYFLRSFMTGTLRTKADVEAANTRAAAAEEKYDRLMEKVIGDLTPSMLRLTAESERFSAASARNAELMEKLISAVLSALSGMTKK